MTPDMGSALYRPLYRHLNFKTDTQNNKIDTLKYLHIFFLLNNSQMNKKQSFQNMFAKEK